MVTSRQLPSGSVVIKPRRGIGGAGLLILLIMLFIGVGGLAVVGLFAPARLATIHEQALGLLHGGIVNSDEQTFVDGCVAVEGADGARAITRTHRTVAYRDGTTLEVVFSDRPALTNACP